VTDTTLTCGVSEREREREREREGRKGRREGEREQCAMKVSSPSVQLVLRCANREKQPYLLSED
jgi:hypothetical protein